ncbi:HIT family protein [Candidatus Woesearchaeota archaeon]|nr:HIT family protein [Candidatus Woesearchaeota archaeon]
MTEECPFCVIAQKRGKGIRIVYEDKDIIAFLYPTVALGHICVVPKQHIPIFMQNKEEITKKMFEVAHKLAQAVNVPLEVNSTNIVINTGVDQVFSHLSLHIVPRKSGDSINLQWEPKQMSEEDLNSLEQKLMSAGAPAEEEKKETKEISEEYYQKYLRRIP